jgi:hypothetical protein
MDWKSLIEVIAAIGIAFAPILVLGERLIADRGTGARSIQFVAVCMLVPAILILALEKILEPATVGTLIGALTGYLLSGIGDYRPDRKKKVPDDEEPAQRAP